MKGDKYDEKQKKGEKEPSRGKRKQLRTKKRVKRKIREKKESVSDEDTKKGNDCLDLRKNLFEEEGTMKPSSRHPRDQ